MQPPLQVPVDFEYEIVEVKPNPAFRVEPARGVVPGRGRVTVDMWFCPLALTTEEAVIEVRGKGVCVCVCVGGGV